MKNPIEVITWLTPAASPDETKPGTILLGWLACRRTGKAFWCPVVRRAGRWCLQNDEPIPDFVAVEAYAMPPNGPSPEGIPT